jgi:hypothetical protein
MEDLLLLILLFREEPVLIIFMARYSAQGLLLRKPKRALEVGIEAALLLIGRRIYGY